MTSKREEERNEKIIRGLMKLPPNRQCINCNSLGPQYVCTDFWTFVCTTCSGLHREFTHRVKSVSMAKFTSQEVDALQKGGNQRAKEYFLKAWDPQKNRLPDNSNIENVRQFIKNSYVDKIYSVEKSFDRPPRDPQKIQSPEDQTRRASSYHSYSQSPPYDFQYEERQYGKRASGLSRKPGSDRGHYGGSPSSFMSPRNSTGHQNDDNVSNDAFFTRASDSSVSRDGVRNNGEKSLHPQRASSFDGSSMSFKSVNFLGQSENGFTCEQPAVFPLKRSSSTSLQQSLFPRTLYSSESHGTTFAQQKFAPTPLSGATTELQHSPLAAASQPYPITDITRSTNENPSQGLQKSSVNLFPIELQQQQPSSDVAAPDNEGWAIFDMPRNVVPVVKENIDVPSDGYILGNFNPFSIVNQSSSGHDLIGHYPSATVDAFGKTSVSSDTQLWNAFEYTSGEQPKETSGVDAVFKIGSHMRPADKNDPSPSSFLSSNFIMELNTPMVSSLGGQHSLTNNQNPTNPFDLPDDSEVESNRMFWDMSSLQAALPNAQPPSSSFIDQAWFPESFIASYASGGVPFDSASGSLGFVAGSAVTTHIPNIHAQGSVASPVGGNPFA